MYSLLNKRIKSSANLPDTIPLSDCPAVLPLTGDTIMKHFYKHFIPSLLRLDLILLRVFLLPWPFAAMKNDHISLAILTAFILPK